MAATNNRTDCELVRLTSALRARPDGVEARRELTDLITSAGPTPVRLHHIPDWLRRSWLRACRQNLDLKRDTWHASAGWEVLQMIDRYLRVDGGSGFVLDHCGSTEIHGQQCFVTEPYRKIEDAPAIFGPLAQMLGTVAGWSPVSHWGHGTIRVLLFPPVNR